MPLSLYEQLTAQRAQRLSQSEADDSYLQNAPNAGAGMAVGLFHGFTSRLKEQDLEGQLKFEDARNRATDFIKSIPQNERNFPIILRLMTDLSSAQPGKKHGLLDYFTKPPDQNEAAITGIWKKLRGVIPDDANVDKQVRQPLPSENRLSNDTPAARAGIAAGATPAAQSELVTQKADPNKLQFEEQGRFQHIGQIFHGVDPATNQPTSFSAAIDQKTGKMIFKPVTNEQGQTLDLRTPAEKIAATRIESQNKLLGDRAEMKQAAEMSELSKDFLGVYMSPNDIIGMKVNDPERWQKMADLFSAHKSKVEGEKSKLRETGAAKNEAQTNALTNPTKMTPEERKVFDSEIESRVQQHFNNSSALDDRTSEELETQLKKVDPILADVARGKKTSMQGMMDYSAKGGIKPPDQIDKEVGAIKKSATARGQKKYDNELNRWRGIYRKVMMQFREAGQEPPPRGTIKTIEQLRATAKAFGLNEKDAYELMHNGFGFVIQGIDKPDETPAQPPPQ